MARGTSPGRRGSHAKCDAPPSVAVGKRVEIHPGLDRWMMGDRYGVVTKHDRVGRMHVKLDKSGKTIKLCSRNIHQQLDGARRRRGRR